MMMMSSTNPNNNPRASFVKLTRQTMSLRRHFSFSAHGHEPWKLSECVSGYFKSGVNMMQMLDNGQSYGGKVELALYATGNVYSYEDNKSDEYFRASYKNNGMDVSKPEVINVSFNIAGKEEAIDLFNPLCMLKNMRLVLNEQYKVFIAQECADQLECGTHFDTAPLPWETDVYACVDMLASWMYVVDKKLARHEWTSATAKVMHCVSSKYQQLKSYGDCAPEYVETDEWSDIVGSIRAEIMDETIVNGQLMAIQHLAVFFFHTAYTAVADCYATPRVFSWPYEEVEALYETITESREVYELAYTYHNDFLPIMEVVYGYNKWMTGDFVMIEHGDDKGEGGGAEECYDAQRVRSIAQAASFFVNDCSYAVFVEDVETEEDLKVLDELVELGVCIKVKKEGDAEFYRSKRYDDMFQLIIQGISSNTSVITSVITSFCFNFKSMADYTAGLVATHELSNVVCFSPEGHYMHAAAYNSFEPIRLYNPYNPFDNGDDKYREECRGKFIIIIRKQEVLHRP
tara:strand:+ start:2117 stop:3664 length:1548 start_codon:yes stop_codon:yes gene_type:complete